MFLTKRHHWFSFIFCMLGDTIFHLFELQTNGTASAQEEHMITIAETKQIKLTGHQEDHQFSLCYQLSQKQTAASLGTNTRSMKRRNSRY